MRPVLAVVALLAVLPSAAQARKVMNPTLSLAATLISGSFTDASFDPPSQSTLASGGQFLGGASIDIAGAITVPTALTAVPTIHFPDVTGSSNGVDYSITNITLTLAGTEPATGTLDPFTGAASLGVHMKARVTYTGCTTNVGPFCYSPSTPQDDPDALSEDACVISPIDLALSTAGGTPYDETAGTLTVRDDAFAIPGGSSGCDPKFSVSPRIIGAFNSAAKLSIRNREELARGLCAARADHPPRGHRRGDGDADHAAQRAHRRDRVAGARGCEELRVRHRRRSRRCVRGDDGRWHPRRRVPHGRPARRSRAGDRRGRRQRRRVDDRRRRGRRGSAAAADRHPARRRHREAAVGPALPAHAHAAPHGAPVGRRQGVRRDRDGPTAPPPGHRRGADPPDHDPTPPAGRLYREGRRDPRQRHQALRAPQVPDVPPGRRDRRDQGPRQRALQGDGARSADRCRRQRVRVADGPIVLCRCGKSQTKPFCDKAHRETGFESCPRA